MRLRATGRAALGTVLLWLLACAPAQAQDAAVPESEPAAEDAKDEALELTPLDDELPETLTLFGRERGIKLGDPDSRFFMHAWLRGQLRYSDPFDSDPRDFADLESPPGSDFGFRRARLKLEGHIFDPRVGFYVEQALTGNMPLLDMRLDVEPSEDLRLRIGQHKALYNRERVDSSGKQAFVDRSIANYAFTIDRQRGVTLFKEFASGRRGDNWLMAGLYQGDGRDPGPRGNQPMYMLRWQWHFMGEVLPFSQTDYEFSEKPLGSFSLAAARVRGPYTRFSTSGGGQLDGFSSGGEERYTLEQWQQGFAWRHNGFSVQQEYHQKRIEDHETGLRSKLTGGYAQLGQAWPVNIGRYTFPFQLGLRYAWVDWKNTPQDRTQQEITLGANLFLAGHDSKFTADVSQISIDEPGVGDGDDVRFRLQWDVSF